MPSVAKRYGAGSGAGSHGVRTTAANAVGRPGDEMRAPVVLMVSGGADSTALLVLAATSALDIGDGRGTARIAQIGRAHV